MLRSWAHWSKRSFSQEEAAAREKLQSGRSCSQGEASVSEKLQAATETRKAEISSPKARQVPSAGPNKLRTEEVTARRKQSEGGHGPGNPRE